MTTSRIAVVLTTKRSRHGIKVHQILKAYQQRGGDFKLIAVKGRIPLASELCRLAHNYPQVDVMAAGGDGFHLMVNEEIEALPPELRARFTLIPSPAGNANDHFRARFGRWRSRTLRQQLRLALQLLDRGERALVDVIRIKADGLSFSALSYAGIGLTVRVAENINRRQYKLRHNAAGKLRNPPFKLLRQWWLESVAVAQEVWRAQPMRVEINGIEQSINSVTVHSIKAMAKVLCPNPHGDPADGQIEVLVCQAGRFNRCRVVLYMLRAIRGWLKPLLVGSDQEFKELTIRLLEPASLMRDGEPEAELPANTVFVISCDHHGRSTLAA